MTRLGDKLRDLRSLAQPFGDSRSYVYGLDEATGHSSPDERRCLARCPRPARRMFVRSHGGGAARSRRGDLSICSFHASDRRLVRPAKHGIAAGHSNPPPPPPPPPPPGGQKKKKTKKKKGQLCQPPEPAPQPHVWRRIWRGAVARRLRRREASRTALFSATVTTISTTRPTAISFCVSQPPTASSIRFAWARGFRDGVADVHNIHPETTVGAALRDAIHATVAAREAQATGGAQAQVNASPSDGLRCSRSWMSISIAETGQRYPNNWRGH